MMAWFVCLSTTSVLTCQETYSADHTWLVQKKQQKKNKLIDAKQADRQTGSTLLYRSSLCVTVSPTTCQDWAPLLLLLLLFSLLLPSFLHSATAEEHLLLKWPVIRTKLTFFLLNLLMIEIWTSLDADLGSVWLVFCLWLKDNSCLFLYIYFGDWRVD